MLSTAHMRIVPALLGWQDPGSAFSAAMQLAALAAVASYFWQDVRGLIFGSIYSIRRRNFRSWDFRFAVWIVLATIPIVIAGVLLSPILNQCGTPLRSLTVIGLSCIIMAALLAVAEVYCNHSRTFEHVTLKDALIVGIAQAGALIPGISRSGSTLTAALFLDLRRTDAARFSFLLGLLVASLSAFVAIWGLLRILENFSAWPFVIYRAFIGVVLLVGVMFGWLV